MMPAQIQQIEREIAHLEREIDGYGVGLATSRVEYLRGEVRRKWLMIKPFVTAAQIRLRDASRNV